MACFQITSDAGTVTHMRAENRTEAIKTYCAQTGTSADYVKALCVVRRA